MLNLLGKIAATCLGALSKLCVWLYDRMSVMHCIVVGLIIVLVTAKTVASAASYVAWIAMIILFVMVLYKFVVEPYIGSVFKKVIV